MSTAIGQPTLKDAAADTAMAAKNDLMEYLIGKTDSTPLAEISKEIDDVVKTACSRHAEIICKERNVSEKRA